MENPREFLRDTSRLVMAGGAVMLVLLSIWALVAMWGTEYLADRAMR